ncbi:P-type ATPase-like protein [Tothia fuscella]|uniref:Cation-transporting ATPase n=1 Tax=Tothia fuscella TaxID=1048955 RepID=A0A9P4TUG9_9PEZI|nr:P-type ATPase-like protein [Tothia fuscella]
MTDVEMATEEMFSGPLAESVPTSISSFAHRRFRSDSTASFTFFNSEEENSTDTENWRDHDAIEDGDSVMNGHDARREEEEEELEVEEDYSTESDDLEAARRGSIRRKSSEYSRKGSVDRPLLLHRMSTSSSRGSGGYGKGRDGRVNQKIYILTEDLTIVVAGFKTSYVGFLVYIALCVGTFGLGFLLLRWLPRWYVKLIGTATPLRECDWVVVENQWNEMIIQNISIQTYGRSLSSIFGTDEKATFRHRDYHEDDDPVITQLRSLDYRYIRFCFHPLKDKFLLGNTWKDPSWTDVRFVRSGLDEDEKDYRERVFGPNAIDIEEKTTMQLLMDEAFHPFYVFQIASLVLWSLDEYYYYAACIAILSVASIVTTLIETKATMKRLREVSRFECDVRVLRNGFWRSVESSDLVPGDVYEVTDPSLTQLPCDSLLLSGDCIVNESMLTGESVPVSKVPATDEALGLLSLATASVHPDIAKHILFCGTKIIRARRPQEGSDDEAAALAMAVRTGFNTTKGALVRSMLFPKPSGFKFYRDSFRYISVMGGIAAIGFVASFINFIRLGLSWKLIIVRALDLITIVVPPALPATLTIGINFALSRLKGKQIFCISPQRINVAGKLDIICFDKTGTLTEDGLDVLGVRVTQKNGFSELLADVGAVLPRSSYERDPTVDYDNHRAILHTMATCHSLRSIDGELLGDPLDQKMFEFTNWQFEEGEQRGGGTGGMDGDEDSKLTPSVARPPPGEEYDADDIPNDPNRKAIELGVLKTFEFVSQLRRASVVVRQFGARHGEIYVKGAPEVMQEICRPGSFPEEYEQLLAYYTHRGYRVIACAAKSIPKMSWVKVQKMTRKEAESDLEFIGFIIFENKLKERTDDVILELERANIRKVMCTGDNILTAISVARECDLINPTAHCFVPHFVEGDSRTALSKLSWESVDNPIYTLDETTLKPLPPPAEGDASLPYDISNLRNYSLACSGEVFRWIVDYAPDRLLKQLLVSGQVFARMSPDEKHELVEKLQSIDYTVGFCGDGANDCGALKAADVGISLSEAEASVAAPFTSRVFDISCVPLVIAEGRAALVTSFSCFKYMSLYSAVQFTSVSFLYASASNLGDFQFLYIDLFLILPIAVFMGWSGPYPILSRKRPTASLVSRKVLIPLLGQIFITVMAQLIAFEYVQRQSWYVPPVLDRKHSNSENSQDTTLFLLSCYLYILWAVVLSVGRPFREPMSGNLPFVVTMAAALFFTTYLLLDPAKWLMSFMELTYMSFGFKIFILALALVSFGVSYVSEMAIFPRLARWVGRMKEKYGRKKKRKEYKLWVEGMRI